MQIHQVIGFSCVLGSAACAMELDPAPDSGRGDGTGDDAGQWPGADPEPEESEPPSLDPVPTQPGVSPRIESIVEVDGDLVLRASVAEAIAARYPGAAEYAIRLSPARRSVLTAIVSNDANTLELIRTSYGQMDEGAGSSQRLCFPSPFDPPVVEGCTETPCPWEKWPVPDGSSPNCLDVDLPEPTQARIRGWVEGRPVSLDIVAGEPTPTVVGLDALELDDAALERIDDIADVSADVESILGEFEPMQVGCFKCWILQDALSLGIAGCMHGDLFSCGGVLFGADSVAEACKGCE